MKIHKLFIVVGLVVFAGFLIGWVAYRESCHAVSQNPQTMAFDTRIAALRKYVLQVGAKGDWPFPEQPCLLAVSTEGEVLRLPEDFQTLVRRERISISSPEAALELATSYVGVSSPFKVLVISNPGMIPGRRSSREVDDHYLGQWYGEASGGRTTKLGRCGRRLWIAPQFCPTA